jgi:hypothetical protein
VSQAVVKQTLDTAIQMDAQMQAAATQTKRANLAQFRLQDVDFTRQSVSTMESGEWIGGMVEVPG